jgi:hypothetical protein
LIYIQDNVMKVAGISIPGQFKSIEISHAATIDEIEDESGKKKKQPTGYEDAKIAIELILEETTEKSVTEQIEEIQKLFKSKDQTKAKVFKIVNSDTAARNIYKVYFKSLTHKNSLSISYASASLEFVEYNPIVISTIKSSKSSKKKSSGDSVSSINLSKEYVEYLKNDRGKAKTSNTVAVDDAYAGTKVARAKENINGTYKVAYATN